MTVQAPDGRRTRWEAHRRTRREELVDAAVRAIRMHGPGVGMDEVAAEAGTSKAAVYRYFTDRGELYLAVCTQVCERLVSQLTTRTCRWVGLLMPSPRDPRSRAIGSLRQATITRPAPEGPHLNPVIRACCPCPAEVLITARDVDICTSLAGPFGFRRDTLTGYGLSCPDPALTLAVARARDDGGIP